MNSSKRFAKYVSQNIFGMLGVSCYIIVDTFFISKAAGSNGITVLNLVMPIYNLIFAIGSMAAIGSATRFAILRAQKEKRAEYYFSNAVFWVCIISVVFIAAGILIPDKLLKMMGGDSEIVALGTSYTRIFLLFTPFFMLNYIVSAFVRNDNAPSLAMTATVVGSLSNILFDYILMFPMKMGLAGAALATAFSPIISIAICSTHFFTKTNTIKFVLRKPSLLLFGQSCGLGISACVGELSSGVTTTVFNFLILGLAGNIGVAAYGVVANYAIIVTSILNGVSQGAQPLISEAHGKRDKANIRKFLKLCIGTAFGIAVLVYAVVFCFTKPLTALFNSEQSFELAEYAFTGMRLYFLGFLVSGFNTVAAGFLSATERSFAAFVISMLRGVAAIIGCSFLLSSLFGMTGIWLAFGASELITAIVSAAALRKSNKRV